MNAGHRNEASEALLKSSDVVDLHNDLEVPVRVLGYDPGRRHANTPFPMPFMGHTDIPRLTQAGYSGVVFDVATNVFRSPSKRLDATMRNVERIRHRSGTPDFPMRTVSGVAEYRACRRDGVLAGFVGIQGANAFEADPEALLQPWADVIHRVTLVHLSSSVMGGSSSPSQPDEGLTGRGAAFVEACIAGRVLVDLAHAGPRTFGDVVDLAPPDVPLVVTHTGVSGVRPHWRNLSDDQIRAIADRGGVIGVLFHGNFLARVPPAWPCRRRHIVDHLEHLMKVGGEGIAALGTDYDGMITPPWDLHRPDQLVDLVQDMLDRGWGEGTVRGILGANALRVMERVRP